MSDRMKVLWLIKGLGIGGAEKLLSMYLPYLDRGVFDYNVAYFLEHKNALVKDFNRWEIPVFCLKSNQPYDLSILPKLIRLLQKEEIDILHINSPFVAIAGRCAAHLAGVSSVIYTEHGLVERQNPLTKLGNRLTYSLNDASIGVSRGVINSMEKWRKPKLRPYHLIYDGIDFDVIDKRASVTSSQIKESLRINNEDLVVGTVGNLRVEKGHLYLLQAARMVLDQQPKVTFVIVGLEKQKGNQEKLEQEASRLGIRDKVIFTGYRPDAISIVDMLDIFAIPSVSEGFSIATLEAMALGKPVIGTTVGGIPELITQNSNGILVEPKNSIQLAEAILELLGDEALRNRMGLKGRAIARDNFDIKKSVKDLEKLYMSVSEK